MLILIAGIMITPPLTKTKANKVPILVKSVISVRFVNKAGIATIRPAIMVEKEGVLIS